MKFNTYQEHAKTFAVVTAEDYDYLLPGLAGEVGEFSQLIAKAVRDDNPPSKENLVKELGDILWFVSLLATRIGVPLSEVAQGNIEKLSSRLHRGTIQGSGDNR